MTHAKRISLKLTPEQRELVKQACGKEAQALELSLEELEERIAPARTTGLPIETIPLPE